MCCLKNHQSDEQLFVPRLVHTYEYLKQKVYNHSHTRLIKTSKRQVDFDSVMLRRAQKCFMFFSFECRYPFIT